VHAGAFEWWTTRSNALRSLDTGLSTPCGTLRPSHPESDVPFRRRCDMFDVQETANDATAGVKSMAVGTQHCLSGQRNRVPVAVICTTNTSSSAIRSLHRALSSSRRRSTGGRGRASWGTK
jgi:hypothetical protein